jgi:hypothetical protein
MMMLVRITDGVTTCDLMDGINYSVAKGGWIPNIASLRKSMLGGAGPYADVTEEIGIHVLGATPAACLANLAKLNGLIDQAVRWARGEPVIAVLLQYTPPGGNQLLQAAIVGWASRDESASLNLGARFHMDLNAATIQDVRLQIVRKGLWLGAPETVVGTAADNGVIQELTFGWTDTTLAPLKLSLATTPTTILDYNALLLVGANAASMQVLDTSIMTPTGTWVDTAETPVTGFGPKFMRLTAAAGSMSLVSGCTLPSTARQIAAFVLVRNNHATATFTVQAALVTPNSFLSLGATQVIGTGANQPQWVSLGTLSVPATPSNATLTFTASTTTGSPTLDVDTLVLLDVTPGYGGYAIQLKAYQVGTLVVDPRALTAPSSLAYAENAGIMKYGTFLGDTFVCNIGNKAATLLLCTYNTSWRISSGGVFVKFTPTAVHTNVSLTPR